VHELPPALAGLAPHALGGAVGRDQLGVPLLEVTQLAVELVVLLVPDLRLSLYVVQVVVPPDQVAQLEDAALGLFANQ
jgi:hypothetical protein